MLRQTIMPNFKDFLLEEMKKRNMSVHAFAHWMGMAHTTINRLLDTRENTEPSAKTLAIMSEKLNVPIDVLFALAYPNIENAQFRNDPEALALAQQITELPADKREMMQALIVGLLAQNKQPPD